MSRTPVCIQLTPTPQKFPVVMQVEQSEFERRSAAERALVRRKNGVFPLHCPQRSTDDVYRK